MASATFLLSPTHDGELPPLTNISIYADTVDIESLGFHDVWGCLLTPENIAARIHTDDLRYHVWVATKRIIESGLIDPPNTEALVRPVMDQFMVELGLVLLDLFPGPLVLFVDPRLHNDAPQMVARATAIVTKFDQAHVERWRVMLPATEDGILAARELTRHDIQTNLSVVACLAHAAACIEAGATMVSMTVGPIMAWFEQLHGTQPCTISPDHPGIKTIQSCAAYIHHHGIRTTLLATDVREWSELSCVGGLGAVALCKDQLDQIPMQRLVTLYPRPGDASSPATEHSLQAPYPPHYLPDNATGSQHGHGRSFLASLPAESRNLITAVMYVRLGKMAEWMKVVEGVVREEVKKRVWLDRIPLDALYQRRPRSGLPLVSASAAVGTTVLPQQRARSKSKSRSAGKQEQSGSTTQTKSPSRRSRSKVRKEPPSPASSSMVDGVDYF